MKHTPSSIKKMIATRRRNANKRVRLAAKQLLGDRVLHAPQAPREVAPNVVLTFTGPVTIQVST